MDDYMTGFGTQLSGHGHIHKTDLETRRNGTKTAFYNIWMGHLSVVCCVFFMTFMKRMNFFTVA